MSALPDGDSGTPASFIAASSARQSVRHPNTHASAVVEIVQGSSRPFTEGQRSGWPSGGLRRRGPAELAVGRVVGRHLFAMRAMSLGAPGPVAT